MLLCMTTSSLQMQLHLNCCSAANSSTIRTCWLWHSPYAPLQNAKATRAMQKTSREFILLLLVAFECASWLRVVGGNTIKMKVIARVAGSSLLKVS
jgi:hypothetical protein